MAINEHECVPRQPFRELRRRPKANIGPESWLPLNDKEEPTYNLRRINGVYQMPKHNEEKITELIRTFKTRADDVFVCTYVKSGTTWTQQIITLLLNQGEQGDKGYSSVVPWLESTTFDDPPIVNGEPFFTEAIGWTLGRIEAHPGRRFLKTHANLKNLPAGSAPGLKVIYVARNPKDVCVSLYHQAVNRDVFGFDGNVSDMMRCFVTGRCENGSWFDHVLEWWEAAQADPEHVLFLRYEDMYRQPEEYIRKIADFLDISHTPQIISKTAAGSSISVMKQNPKANILAKENHLRKGGIGGWRNFFTVRESETFDKIYLEQTKGSGLKMDFGDGLEM